MRGKRRPPKPKRKKTVVRTLPAKSSQSKVVGLQVSQSYSGPLPRPSDLQAYEDTLPGVADRIVSMAEREQVHRHEAEDTDRVNEFRLARFGQWGFISFIAVCLGTAIWQFSIGQGISGGVAIVTAAIPSLEKLLTGRKGKTSD